MFRENMFLNMTSRWDFIKNMPNISRKNMEKPLFRLQNMKKHH